ncbi:unnamed protein product [Prunus brigantina]
MRTMRKGAPLLTLKETIIVDKLKRIFRRHSPPTCRLGSADERVDPRIPTRRSISAARIVKVSNVIDQQCCSPEAILHAFVYTLQRGFRSREPPKTLQKCHDPPQG